MLPRSTLVLCAVVLTFGVSIGRRSDALVINEIMYHSEEVDDRPFEWIEFYNERLDPFDLGDYRICNGVQFVFPPRTILEGYSYLIVCADPTSFDLKYGDVGCPVLGGWVGALANNGEELALCNPAGIHVLEVDYNDRGKWPVAADGTGHSLSLISPYLDLDDADNWVQSLERGGSPGEWNGHSLQQSSGPLSINGMDGAGFILDWLTLGPYTGAGCNLGVSVIEADWLRGTSAPRETDLIWRDEQVVPTNYSLAQSTGLHANAGSAQPLVELYHGASGTINLNDAVYPPNPEDVMAYAFTYVDNVTGSPLDVTIGCASDDAISVLVNGVVVHTNDTCRGVGNDGEAQDHADARLLPGKNLIAVKVFERGGGWAFRLRIEERGSQQPITSNCQIQLTADVDAGLDFDGSGTAITDPCDDGGGGGPDPVTLPGQSPVVINEGFFRSTGDRWVELYNRSGKPVDLGGYYMTDDSADLTKALLPAAVLPAGGFVSYTDVELGLSFAITEEQDRVFVALVEPDGDVVADAYNFEPLFDGYSEARLPDGDREFDDGADPTRGAPNSMTVNQDIVINEIMYKPIDGDPEKEYLELYNRGSSPVDLTGWALTRGVDFAFAPGTSIAAGDYLVVARNPALIRSIYGLGPEAVVGPGDALALEDFGVLRDSGERITLKDPMDRTVDTVHYVDGGEWPRWADGLGSSVELIDPYQDNRFGQAWDASDDSGKAVATQFSYIGRHGGGESELHLLLNSRGITVVDDVSIIGGGVQTVDTPLIDHGEVWKYLKGTEAPPPTWMQRSFNDSGWDAGATSIGYGDNDDATELLDMQNNYMTVFCRKSFNVSNPAAIDELWLSIIIDDGFVAYLNGTEVARDNVSGTGYGDRANNAVSNGDLVEKDITSFKNLLVSGTNMLAVSVHNAGLTSSDLTFNPALLDRTTTVTGGAEQVVNGSFDANTTGWIIEGTHVKSGRSTTNPIRGSGSLKIIASGRGDNKVNRIETGDNAVGPVPAGLSTLNAGEDLQISFRARWVVGSQTLLTHGYQHAMAKSHELAVPEDLGSPGRINSVTIRQNARSGGNLGPVMTDVVQDPAVPGANEDVKVRIRVSDSDGVNPNEVWIRHSTNNPSSNPSSVRMSSIGDGWYEGTIPGRPLGDKVVFFITAEDALGVPGRYPVDISLTTHPLVLNPSSPGLDEQRYLVYRHAEREPATPYHNYRFWFTDADEAEMSSRRLLSNHLMPGSFVFGGDRIYYESHARFSGSPFARGGWGGSFRVAMPRGDLLHETIRKFNLEQHQGGNLSAKERISHYLLRQQNGGDTVVPYSDLQVLVRWQVNDRATGTREHVWVPDVQFVGAWFPGDGSGDFFELDDRFVISDTGGRDGNADARLLYPPPSNRDDGNGANKENYRWFFGLRAKNGADDYSSLIDLARVMDPGVTGDSAFRQEIWDICNVEELIRQWAVRMNTDDWDSWGCSRGKNCYLYRPPIDGRYNLLAWDMELTYGSTTSFLIPSDPGGTFNPGGFGEVNRVMRQPETKRIYYGVLDEMVNGPKQWFTSDYLRPFAESLQAIGMTSTEIAGPGGYIDQRRDLLRTRIQSVVYPQRTFTITTSPFTTGTLRANLAGNAPVSIDTILVSINSGEAVYYPASFPTLTSWVMNDIALIPGVNDLELIAFDRKGNEIDSDSIRITSTVTQWSPPSIDSVTPPSGLPGETVEILGHDFHNGLKVFYGELLSPAVIFDEFGADADRIMAEIPAGLGMFEVTVRNADGKTSTPVPFEIEAPAPEFVRGDANYDGFIDVGDAIATLLHVYRGLALRCLEAADVDDSGVIEQTDAIYLLAYLYLGGPQPPAPFPSRATDTDGDATGCEG